MKASMSFTVALWLILAMLSGCNRQTDSSEELRRFPVDAMDGIIAQSQCRLDSDVTADGNGSVRISTDHPISIPLYEIRDLSVEDATLMYQALVRTENVRGRVYLEMWCGFDGQGEFFSRDLDSPLSGTCEWTTRSTPFFLQGGQKPDYIKLNLVIDGSGTAWIDDIRLFKS